MSTTTIPDTETDRARVGALETVPDPEIPVVSIDLGILRDIAVADGATLEVTITPTYSGCPAMSQIAEDIGHALDAAGLGPWRIRTALSPAWTTDWITDAARDRLREFGIAPPKLCGAAPAAQPLRFVPRAARAGAPDTVACPRCGSRHTQEISRFASTACKALYRCLDCREPFGCAKPY
ncbi:1,2-phenylacetyl-CoA epoxidase subunit PaaD [Cupriavidus basilensis]